MLLFEFIAREVNSPLEKIVEFVQRLIVQNEHDGRFVGDKERRREGRFRMAVPVIAEPLDEELRAAGEAFVAVTKDISTRRIALHHHEAVTSTFLAVRLTDCNGRWVTGAIKVLPCRPVSHFYEVAGEDVTKLYDGLDRPAKDNPAAPGRLS